MSFAPLSFLQTTPCIDFAPTYEVILTQVAKTGRWNDAQTVNFLRNEIGNPLEALQRRVGAEVEKLFQQKGERTLILGCMHHNGSREFTQTQTDGTSHLPRVLSSAEDHRHLSAVTIDTRYAPDECIELPMDCGLLCFPFMKAEPIQSDGPDFARRDCENPAHLEDFRYVKDIKKIYAERMPFVEQGPLDSNLPFFRTIHRLLGKEGVFAFDFSPKVKITHTRSDGLGLFTVSITPKEVSQSEIDQFIKDSPYSYYFAMLKKGYPTNIICKAHKACPEKPCSALISQIAEESITTIANKDEVARYLTKFREEMSHKPKAILTEEELAITIGTQNFTLSEVCERSDLPIDKFEESSILVKFNGDRTQDEIGSLYNQIENYRVLNVDPGRQDTIHPTTKARLDELHTLLVERVIFPRLKKLQFEKVSFDPNGRNRENNRPFDRVIHVKKI